MKQKLVALILAVAVALSLAGCTEEVKQTEEPKESETYSNDFEAGVKNVTVQDLTYSVPTAWEKRRGENGFTYYYPASGDSFLAVSFNEINAKNHSITEWENFNTYLSAMEGDDYKNVSKEMRQNKNKVEYAHHAGKLNVGSDVYDMEAGLFNCEGGFVQIGFLVKENLGINYTQDISSIFDSVEVPKKLPSDPNDENSPEPTSDASEEPSAEPSEAAQEKPAETTTTGQRNALSKAKQYLSIMPFSHSGLISQLKYEGYTTEEATYGADNCGADWNEQAAKKAQQYMDIMDYSRQGLIDQLKYEGFTQSQAEYGVSAVGY